MVQHPELTRLERFDIAPSIPRPIQQPVDFQAGDTAAADLLIERFGRVAAAIVADAPPDGAARNRLVALTKGANRIIGEGRARDGARVRDIAVAANYADDKHVRKGVTGPWTRLWADLAVRLVVASRGPVLLERISTRPERIRRESVRVGYDRHPNCTPVKPQLTLYVSSLDKQLGSWRIPFATGTTWDRTNAGADHEQIAQFEQSLGEPIPGSFDEHIERLLAEREEGRSCLKRAIMDSPDLLVEAGLDPEIILDQAFAPLCVVDELPFGGPTEPGTQSSGLIRPGDNASVIEQLSRVISGVADLGTIIDPSHLGLPAREVALDLNVVTDWALVFDPWKTKFFAYGDDLLLRTESSDSGSRSRLWRTFGLSNTSQQALALAQHAAEPWPRQCARRAAVDCAPGRNHAKDPAFRMALGAMIRVADAARVTAERDRQSQRLDQLG